LVVNERQLCAACRDILNPTKDDVVSVVAYPATHTDFFAFVVPHISIEHLVRCYAVKVQNEKMHGNREERASFRPRETYGWPGADLCRAGLLRAYPSTSPFPRSVCFSNQLHAFLTGSAVEHRAGIISTPGVGAPPSSRDPFSRGGVLTDVDRKAQRQRTFKGGSIAFDAAHSTDCIIRNLSDTGACLEVPNPSGIPDIFKLIIRPEILTRTCKVAWRTNQRIGVRFT
jgi:hypothetical protein